MKITEVSTIAVAEPGGRRYVIVKLSTDEGISGYGEAPAGPDPETAVAAISRETAPVRGQDPARLLFLDQELRRSGASPASRAAVNVAALDILARSANAPLYEFLGGPTRNKARAMAVVEGKTAGELRDAVLKAKDAGHRAFSIPLTMPNGNERGRVFYTAIRSTFDSLRQAAGSECDFVLDCGGQTTPGEALSIADRMEEFHLFWMDEPCGDLNAAPDSDEVRVEAGVASSAVGRGAFPVRYHCGRCRPRTVLPIPGSRRCLPPRSVGDSSSTSPSVVTPSCPARASSPPVTRRCCSRIRGWSSSRTR